MTRTTPPRPLDIAALFPELRAHSATATRLHPRPGAPSAADSSVGGPVLWPAGEPWPTCTDGDLHYVFELSTPATVRRSREIYAAARERGGRYELTDAERAELSDSGSSEPRELLDQPIALVPVAQLYRRDIPDFAGPDGADVLQVLWCPLDHPEAGYNPSVRLYRRNSADIGQALAAPPQPAVVNEHYLPNPCVVHPERISEYPYRALLPKDLGERIAAWDEAGSEYQLDLSLAPGWKVGGFANWSLTDPYPVDCAECGTPMTLLFTADSSEWHGTGGSWRPVEEPAGATSGPTDVVIGRSYALYIFRCPVSFDHPPATAMQ
ncbi:hypothetical protein KZZ52_37385 [Dactylosporangium sp. AC04546]|uniref:hypothetical protein n=1 Tax=Dactylosporangium sp. AC04546 TaxID=2862460 RepID=UPI001EDFBE0F|nr:hypothetical protein [Dactylosporangium sp. AC04546]WVK79638.1 hypothetical protein KZZ52_37385 [Dactylosporangium sp. AC04546]